MRELNTKMPRGFREKVKTRPFPGALNDIQLMFKLNIDPMTEFPLFDILCRMPKTMKT